jgi:hypothetical protein
VLDRFAAGAQPGSAAHQLSSILANQPDSVQSSRSILVTLILAASLAATVFGLAIWKHRQTLALVASAIGAGFLVAAASVLLVTTAPNAPWLTSISTGLTASLLFTALWLAITLLGAISQVRRAKAMQLEQDAGIAGTIRTKPVAANAPKKKITRIPSAQASDKKAA